MTAPLSPSLWFPWTSSSASLSSFTCSRFHAFLTVFLLFLFLRFFLASWSRKTWRWERSLMCSEAMVRPARCDVLWGMFCPGLVPWTGGRRSASQLLLLLLPPGVLQVDMGVSELAMEVVLLAVLDPPLVNEFPARVLLLRFFSLGRFILWIKVQSKT